MGTTINTEDLKTAYQYKNSIDLRYTWFIFKILQSPFLVKFLGWCAGTILKYNLPFKFIIRQTVFKIFCAGENLHETLAVIEKLGKYKVKSVLDYVSEGEKTDRVFCENAQIIVSNIERLGNTNPGNYVSIKLSGLEDTNFFRQVNDKTITEIKEPRFIQFLKRLDAICSKASEKNVIVYIDAEDRYMQDIFDRVTESMMEKYNIGRAVIYNTLQMYLTDRLNYIDFLVKDGESKNYIPGIKLVRGAYLEREREAAIKEKRESPVYRSKEGTDQAFNQAVKVCLANYSRVNTCIATHNDKSVLYAIKLIEESGMINHKANISFSQLYGMSDHLTFNLAAGGYTTSKYLPYGEVKKAIPYLIRRAEENSSINGQLSDEVSRLNREIQRRREVHKVK